MAAGTGASAPLAGRTILITRAQAQAHDLKMALEALGARVVEAPVIAIAEPEDWGPADAAISRLEEYDWIVFTSANAVEHFFERARRAGALPRLTAPASLAAIGAATAESLKASGHAAVLVASPSSSEGLIASLETLGSLEGRRFLIPRAAAAREVLPEGLRQAGARVDVVTVYRTVQVPVAPEVKALLSARAVDAVAFTSGSTVTHLLAGIGGAGPLSGVTVAVIGPITEQTARASGLAPAVVASEASAAALAEAIASHFGGAPRGT